jgi:DNA topoisomerase III
LRDRLKEAKGIGTPATRAEIIRGLKTQEFLTILGKNVVPTDRGLSLFGVLQRADPALVDPGVTAQLECLLDDVLVGRQKMMGAIDAVCVAAARIIERLTSSSEAIATPIPGVVASQRNGERPGPPTPAMKRFVDIIAKQKGGIKPPRGYAKSGSVCRGFLDQHAAKNRGSGASGEIAAVRSAPAPIHRDPKMAREPIAVEPAVGAVRGFKSSQSGSREPRAHRNTLSESPISDAPKTSRTRGPAVPAKQSLPPQIHETETPLRIPFGNKAAARQLGAHYRSGRWYAPDGIDLTPFRQRGWL